MKLRTSMTTLLSVAFVLFSHAVLAGALDELSAQNRDKVLASLGDGKKAVSVRVPVQGALWPEFRVFRKLNVTPEIAAAVFADFDNHKNFFGNVGIKKSQVLEGAGTKLQKIAYALKIMIASDEYVCEDQISADLAHDTYQVYWDVIQSKSTFAKSPDASVWSNGSAIFEPYDGGTLVAYRSLVAPHNQMGVTMGWVINGAESAVMKTVDALADQIQKEVTQPELFSKLDEQRAVLKKILGS